MSGKERLFIITLLLCTLGWSYHNHSNYNISADNSVHIVEPGEPEPTDNPIQVQEISVPEPKEVTQKEQIKDYIVEVFGEDAPDAILIAECESQYLPERIGDKHLMSYNNGELIGDSVGIFQVRTGGSGWNRAKANGMSVAEFRANLKEYKYNIDYAKTIFDNDGWYAWYNCMRKVL